MTRSKTLLAAALLSGLMAVPGSAANNAAGSNATATRAAAAGPVVVELFTSQGCSSCPPADAYLGELAKSTSVIALGFHVDYWDYIGWKDPFASPASTDRQRRYAATLGSRYLYTPQMVVDGGRDATGSDRSAVGGLIESAEKTPKLPVAIVETSEDHYTVSVPAAETKSGATLWMALFDKEHDTQVARGENGGHTLRDYNAVRELRKLGRWNGKALQVAVDMTLPAERGCAILLQADHAAGDGQGAILGAALLREKK